MNILILTNGEYGDYTFCQKQKHYDYILCADNGMKHAKKLGICPDEILGDFDSCNENDLEFFKRQNVKITKAPCEKDETDTELALDTAISLGAMQIDLWGGIGSRMDHSLANIHLMYKALQKGVEVTLYSDRHIIRLLDKELELVGEKGGLVSLIPFTPVVKGVKTTSLAYGLEDGEFHIGKPYGVSNYMLEETAKVKIEEGVLIVIQARD